MKILYISSVPSPKEFYRIKNTVRNNVNVATYGMNESGFKFHTLIQQGLAIDNDLSVVSLVGRSVSAKTHRCLIWKTITEYNGDNIKYKHLGFINIFGLKQLILSVRFFNNTISWLYKYRDTKDKYIIADAAYVTAIPVVILAKKIMHCQMVAIFCDIYEYMGNVKDARETNKVGLLHRYFRWLMAKTYKNLDGFILLTENMNNVVNVFDKPHLIIEGLVDVNMTSSINDFKEKSLMDVVMYAGALREQYGLKSLIDGFMHYHNENARLWVYGAGDYAQAIINASKHDSRIEFYGLVDNDVVVKKEIEATLLINPRSTDREFTKYSFPSKNMEYMVSGTPVLTTRLSGMPAEYYDYIYPIEGNDAQHITSALKAVFSQDRLILHRMGKKAKQFVLENKNNIVQVQKIIKLLRGLNDD